MAINAFHQQTQFGVGDKVRVTQLIKEGDKSRSQAFDGVVLSIRGMNENKSFTVRRIGAGQIGIERIFPLSAPNLQKVEVLRKGVKGTRRAKLYFLRYKSKKEIEKIYSRALVKDVPANVKVKKAKAKKISSS